MLWIRSPPKLRVISDDATVVRPQSTALRFPETDLTFAQEQRLVASIRPVQFHTLSLERLGGPRDGGYLFPKAEYFGIFGLALGFGVGEDVSFEKALLTSKRAKEVTLVDGTVTHIPPKDYDPNMILLRSMLGESSDERTVSLEDALGNATDAVVKMDVEGYEWEVLDTTPIEVLDRIKVLVIELHCISDRGDGGGGDQGKLKDAGRKLLVLEKLKSVFHQVHLHPNPICGARSLKNGKNIPYCAEMTYVRRDGAEVVGLQHAKLPHPSDSPYPSLFVSAFE